MGNMDNKFFLIYKSFHSGLSARRMQSHWAAVRCKNEYKADKFGEITQVKKYWPSIKENRDLTNIHLAFRAKFN